MARNSVISETITFRAYLGSNLSINFSIGSIGLDELAARSDIITHQHREDMIGIRRILDGNLTKRTGLRIHGGVP